MRKQVFLGCLTGLLCVALLAACDAASSATESTSNTQPERTVASEITPEEKQPYEILREKENETNKIGDEEKQEVELKEALGKLDFYYQEVEESGDFLMGISLQCDKVSNDGRSCVLPIIYVFGPSVDPVLCVGFNYIADEYLNVDTIQIDTEKYRYTYDSQTFLQDIQKNSVTVGQIEKTEELAMRLATEDDIDALVDIVKSDEVTLTFARYNTAKPEFVECKMPEEDKQAITDVLNAYYLYLNASEKFGQKYLQTFPIQKVHYKERR